MAQPATTAPTLFDLIAREWQRPAAAVAARFNADDTAVAFAGSDGSLTIVPTADAETPTTRLRVSADSGLMTIRPRRKPVDAPVTTAPLSDGPPPVAAYRRSGFVVGGGDGRPYHVTPLGTATPFEARLGGPVTAVGGCDGGARVACAADGEIALFAGDDTAAPRRLAQEAAATALAFSPDGRRLAAAHAHGVTVWRLADDAARERIIAFAGGPRAVVWSHDGSWLACPLAQGGYRLECLADGTGTTVEGYPTPVHDVVFSRAGDAVATSGAFRVAAWSMADLPRDGQPSGALRTGQPGLVVVERVAAHPSRDLLAVGYADGLVVVARIGHRDELMVRAGGGAVTALRWSADGHHLAVASADGSTAIASFPPALFK